MAFTNQERVDIRRFCGYGAFGGIASPAFGYRFFQAYGTLEFKLSNLATEEESTLRTVYLTSASSLYVLEGAVYGSTVNLDTDRAGPWTHNKNEVRDRRALFNQMRRDLCAFIGIPPGPDLGDSGMRIVV
jgi:hypothetical protein